MCPLSGDSSRTTATIVYGPTYQNSTHRTGLVSDGDNVSTGTKLDNMQITIQATADHEPGSACTSPYEGDCRISGQRVRQIRAEHLDATIDTCQQFRKFSKPCTSKVKRMMSTGTAEQPPCSHTSNQNADLASLQPESSLGVLGRFLKSDGLDVLGAHGDASDVAASFASGAKSTAMPHFLEDTSCISLEQDPRHGWSQQQQQQEQYQRQLPSRDPSPTTSATTQNQADAAKMVASKQRPSARAAAGPLPSKIEALEFQEETCIRGAALVFQDCVLQLLRYAKPTLAPGEEGDVPPRTRELYVTAINGGRSDGRTDGRSIYRNRELRPPPSSPSGVCCEPCSPDASQPCCMVQTC